MNLFYIERGFYSRTEIGEREIDKGTVHIVGAVGARHPATLSSYHLQEVPPPPSHTLPR
jgi:hypothetical protein